MTWDNRYRPLRKDETILAGVECLTDSRLGWQPATHDIGGRAPDPNYTAHRMYRRLCDPTPSSFASSAPAPQPLE
jgi:hypothetical protein